MKYLFITISIIVSSTANAKTCSSSGIFNPDSVLKPSVADVDKIHNNDCSTTYIDPEISTVSLDLTWAHWCYKYKDNLQEIQFLEDSTFKITTKQRGIIYGSWSRISNQLIMIFRVNPLNPDKTFYRIRSLI